jgi:glycosyltransferase involved in cell wall biosynthesis
VPVVGTRIAMEGMNIEHGVSGWVADTPEDLAAGIVTLLRDDVTWTRLSSGGRDHVEDVLGEQRFERMVVEALEAVGVR